MCFNNWYSPEGFGFSFNRENVSIRKRIDRALNFYVETCLELPMVKKKRSLRPVTKNIEIMTSLTYFRDNIIL